ncbi:hypothetical protein ACK31C_20665 [Aeromonas caviae]
MSYEVKEALEQPCVRATENWGGDHQNVGLLDHGQRLLYGIRHLSAPD